VTDAPRVVWDAQPVASAGRPVVSDVRQAGSPDELPVASQAALLLAVLSDARSLAARSGAWPAVLRLAATVAAPQASKVASPADAPSLAADRDAGQRLVLVASALPDEQAERQVQPGDRGALLLRQASEVSALALPDAQVGRQVRLADRDALLLRQASVMSVLPGERAEHREQVAGRVLSLSSGDRLHRVLQAG
jgi:hypothetical protein